MLIAPLYLSNFGKSATAAMLACLLAACSTVEDLGPSPEAQALAAELRTAMQACSDTQAGSSELLSAQGDQLQLQQEQLANLNRKLDEVQAHMVDSVPGVVQPPIDCKVAQPATSGKMIVGRRENVWLEDVQLSLPARIDTGAETASLDARNIELFERDGTRWVRFEILQPDTGEPIALEKKLERRARIVQAASDEAERRSVIRLGVVIGDVRQYAEFTLSDRSHLDYQILIGRNVLNDVMVVDVSETNLAPPQVGAGSADQ
ncbi:MAG: RimK/LysX family protein [Halioglobus sp.]